MLPTPTTSCEFMMNCLMATARLRVDAEQVLAIECRAQGFWRQFLEQRMLSRVILGPMQAAEAPRVVEAQDLPLSRTRSQCSCGFGGGSPARPGAGCPTFPDARSACRFRTGSIRYFARRSTLRTVWLPRTALRDSAAMGQRRRRSRTIMLDDATTDERGRDAAPAWFLLQEARAAATPGYLIFDSL